MPTASGDPQSDAHEAENARRSDEAAAPPLPKDLSAAFDLLGALPEDFMADGRNDTPPQVR